jgi:hypothetical protein
VHQRRRRRLEEGKGAQAHQGGRNRASTAADTVDSDEKIRAAQWCSDAIDGGRLEEASRGFYSRSGLARGLGFRMNRTDERDAVFGSVSCSR